MPGTNYVGNAYNSLSRILGTPLAGAESPGFDDLSSGYQSGVESGTADLGRRGLFNSGAVPEMYTNLGEQYASGASKVTSSAQLAENKRKQQLLNQILGLTQPVMGQAELQANQQANTVGNIGSATAGLFGTQPQSIFGPAQSGFFTSGLYGNPRAALNQILSLVP